MKNQRALYVGLGLIVAGLVATWFYTVRYENEVHGTLVPVLVAAEDIALGTPLRSEMLSTIDIPQRFVEGRHIPYSQLNEVLGVPVTLSLHAGETLLRSDLTNLSDQGRALSQTVPSGYRAATLDAGSHPFFGGLVRPGDRVDILLTITRLGDEENSVTVSLLQNVIVLGVGSRIRSQRGVEAMAGAGRLAYQATVAVTPQEAQVIAYAQETGTLQLLLRNPDDETVIGNLTETRSPEVMDPARRALYLRREPVAVAAAPLPSIPGLVPGVPIPGPAPTATP